MSGDHPADSTIGAIRGQQERSAAPSSAVDDDQRRLRSDQIIDDAGQTRTGRHRSSTDRDQLDGDRDQAASDRDLAAGIDRRAHELSHDIGYAIAQRNAGKARVRRSRADAMTGTPTSAEGNQPSESASSPEAARARAERMLFACRDAGDLRARDTLAERFLPLARSLARRYESSSEPMDDLMQVASLALVRAIDRFDPARGVAFSSFAVPTIIGELKRHLRDRTWVVRPPRRLQELTLRVEHATRRLSQELDRAPTISELAAELGDAEDQILEAWHALGGRNAISLQAPAGQDDEQTTLQDTLGTSDEDIELAEPRVMLARLMAGMPPRSREVLHLRFEQDLTQAQIGELLGVSQMQVSRRIRQALTQMRVVADEHQRLAEDYCNTQHASDAGAQHAGRNSAGAIVAKQRRPPHERVLS